MRTSQTYRRRASARDAVNGNGAAPSVLEMLVRHLTEGVARSALRRVDRGVHEAVRWTVLRLILGWIGAAILTGAILLLLGAGVKGLEALHCPLWLAYLSTGVLAILIALVALKGILWPREEEEAD
ncbi:MAG TPA: hypothetical protein VJB14_08760 [Planctomycetota bacterium]|nr:hypothetical protein [Planctomycetota bacterium]